MEITNNNLPVFDIVLEEEALEVDQVIEEQESKAEEIETNQQETADPLATSFYEELVNRGYLDESDNFTGSWDELDSMIADLPQRVLNSVIATMPEESKQLLKFVAAAGQDLTKEELKKFFNTYFEESSMPDISTNDSARAYLESVLEQQGLKPRAIQAQLDSLEDEDALIDEAKKVLNSKTASTEEVIRQKEQEVKEKRQAQQNFVRSIQEEIKAQGWKPERVAKVQGTFSEVNNILNQVASNPRAYVQLIDLLTYFDSNKKEFDLSIINKRAEAKAASSLKDNIIKNGFSSSGSKSGSNIVTDNNTNNLDNYEPII